MSSSNHARGVSRPAVLGLVVGALLLVALAIWGRWVAAYTPLAVPGDSRMAAGVEPAEYRGPLGYPLAWGDPRALVVVRRRWRRRRHHRGGRRGRARLRRSFRPQPAGRQPSSGRLVRRRPADRRRGDLHPEGHLLVLDVPPHRYRFGPRAREALDDIDELGGWALAAHPADTSEPWRAGWGRLEGVEIVNFAGSWSRAGWPARLTAAAAYPFNPMYAALRLLADSPSLALWDSKTALSAARAPRPLVAVGSATRMGLSAQVVRRRATSWRLARFRYSSGLICPWARRRLMHAARCSMRYAPAVPPRFWRPSGLLRASFLRSGRGGSGTAREVAAWEAGPWILEADLGRMGPYQTVLVRDGEPVASADGEPLRHEAEQPGTYRVEVYRLQRSPGRRYAR